VADPVLGQAIKAFVVVDDATIDVAAVMRHCRDHLEDFMMPKHVGICETLPKTDSGKIKKKDLN